MLPNGPNQEFYQEMYNYCHGQNGMMGQYYGNCINVIFFSAIDIPLRKAG